MNIFLFEDNGVDLLSPVSLTRPAWAIRCGSYSLAELLPDSENVVGVVRPHLQTLLFKDWTRFSKPLPADGNRATLLVNARLAPTIRNTQNLKTFVEYHGSISPEDNIVMCRSGWALSAAIIPATNSGVSLSHDVNCDRIKELEAIASSNGISLIESDMDLELLDFPHSIVAHHMNGCRDAIEHRISTGQYREIQDGVFVACGQDKPETIVPSSCVFDTATGPIVFDYGVTIGPMCFFRGPVFVGENSKISEHSSIKDCVAISHTCKMGGEIEGVQTEAWSNKQHFGFLGHSYIGSWINLGAGTCNSDLKNTYGNVNMRYAGRKVPTEMQFMGCVMGDYSRTAINTSIYTGKTIGVGSSVYGLTPHNVPSFVNCAQQLNQYGIVPVEVLAITQKRMFARRNITQRPVDVQLLQAVFELTRNERKSEWTTDPIPF